MTNLDVSLWIRVSIREDIMIKAEELPGRVASLNASLTNVNGDDFFHVIIIRINSFWLYKVLLLVWKLNYWNPTIYLNYK